jgi:hypothetical protein
MEKDTLFVVYVPCGGLSRGEANKVMRAARDMAQNHKPDNATVWLFPSEADEYRVECVNPKLVTEEEYSKARKSLNEIEEELKKLNPDWVSGLADSTKQCLCNGAYVRKDEGECDVRDDGHGGTFCATHHTCKLKEEQNMEGKFANQTAVATVPYQQVPKCLKDVVQSLLDNRRTGNGTVVQAAVGYYLVKHSEDELAAYAEGELEYQDTASK